MRPECIQAVSNAIGRQLTQKEAENIEKRISDAKKQLWLKDRETMMGLTELDRLKAAGEQAAKDIEAEALKKQQRVAQTILKHNELKNFIDTQPGLKSDNVKGIMVGDKTLSVESLTQSIRHQSLAFISEEGEPFLPEKIGFDQGNTKMEAVYRELHGENTDNPAAKKYADKLRTLFESQRIRFNSLGGKVGKLDDWAHPQAHSAYLLFKMGKDKWVEFITPKLDARRYIDDNGVRLNEQQMQAFLSKSWESIVYDGQLKREPGAQKGTGARANAHSQHRQLHFKDASSYLDYHKALGEKSLHATLIGHIDSMSKDIALLETMGPNPRHQFDWLQDYAYQEDARNHGIAPWKLDRKRNRNGRIYDEVAGVRPLVGWQAFARYMDAMRSLNLIKLGSSGISTITDINTMMLTAQYNHMSQSKMMVEHLRAFGDAESRRQARSLGIGLDTFAGAVLRHGQEQIANGIAAKLGGAVVRLSGMPFITEANRQAFSVTLMNTLAHVVDRYDSLAAIHKTDARMMFTHGIDESDFAIWKRAIPELWTDGESQLLTANAVLNVPDVDPKLLRRSADKLMALVLDEQNHAVIDVGAEQRALMRIGGGAGTLTGELTRAFWQFKSFALTLPWKHINRALSIESPQSAAAYGAAFFAGSLLFGAMAVQLGEIISGRDPLAMWNWDFAGKALLKSGGVGILGDFLNANNTQYGNSPIGALEGPTVGTAEQLYQLTWGNTVKAMHGEDTHTRAEALRLANSYNPLGTLWFAKSAFNHLVLQNLQETLSPGYLRRMNQRAQREFKQAYYWKPGDKLPSRAPDLGRAFSQ